MQIFRNETNFLQSRTFDRRSNSFISALRTDAQTAAGRTVSGKADGIRIRNNQRSTNAKEKAETGKPAHLDIWSQRQFQPGPGRML